MRVPKPLIAATAAIAAAAVVVAVTRSLPESNDPTAFSSVTADDASVHPDSSAMIDRLIRSEVVAGALLRDAAVLVYDATASSPRTTVTCTIREWGCPFEGTQVPIPEDALSSANASTTVAVVDRAAGKVYQLWQPKRTASGVEVSSGSISDLDGNGWGGGLTGSGASLLAGVIRVGEIAQGNIPHALALTTNTACASPFWPPATKSDGKDLGAHCIPMGTRLQLDPSINLDALGLPPGVRAVARAMQVYGGYVVGVGTLPIGVKFERDQSAAGESMGPAYDRAGLGWDYQKMAKVPWGRLRVLAPVETS